MHTAVALVALNREREAMQVEIRLKKVDLSVSWPTLEASDSRPAANWALPELPRTYPSSSKKMVDWNKMEVRWTFLGRVALAQDLQRQTPAAAMGWLARELRAAETQCTLDSKVFAMLPRP